MVHNVAKISIVFRGIYSTIIGIFLFTFLTVLLQSCIKEVPLISIDKVEPKPVFYMFINPDSSLQSFFGQASGITESEVKIDNATVNLFQNGTLQGNMVAAGSGRYFIGPNKFKPRDSFAVTGTDGVHTFTVKGKIPTKPVIISSDTQTLLIPGLGPAFAIDLTFADSAIDDNYYRLSLKRTWYAYKLDKNLKRIDSTLKTAFINIAGSELAYIQNNYNNYTSKEIIFSDATFNGTIPKHRFYTSQAIHETMLNKTISLELIFENFDKPLFDYYNTRNAHLWQQQSITQIPGVILGNIPGGYGIVAAYSSVSRVILIH